MNSYENAKQSFNVPGRKSITYKSSKTDNQGAPPQRTVARPSIGVQVLLVLAVIALGGICGWFARSSLDARKESATRASPVKLSGAISFPNEDAVAEHAEFEGKVELAEERRTREFRSSLEATGEALEEAEEMESKLQQKNKKEKKKNKNQNKNGARNVDVAAAAVSSASVGHPSSPASPTSDDDDGTADSSSGTDATFYRHGYNIKGNDLEMVRVATTEPSACCSACTDREGCKGWTFVPGTHKCYLKSAGEPLEKAPKHAWVSGHGGNCPATAAPPTFQDLPATDFSRPARPFLIVTAASGNHLCALQQLLGSLAQYEGNTKVLVYDLNWEARLSSDWLSKFNKNVVGPRWFNYSAYPPWFNNRMHYSWKVGIIKEAMELYGDEYGGSILWMDAGNLVTSANGLDAVAALLEKDGFVSATTGGSIERYTHAGMFSHYGMDKTKMVATDKRVTVGRGLACNGALVGFKKDTPAYTKIMKPWIDCAYTKQCIAPKGSSRTNHRQDQSALTVLVSLLNDKEFKCSPGLVKKGLLTQQDHQAVRTCIKPPPGMNDFDDCSHDGHECFKSKGTATAEVI